MSSKRPSELGSRYAAQQTHRMQRDFGNTSLIAASTPLVDEVRDQGRRIDGEEVQLEHPVNRGSEDKEGYQKRDVEEWQKEHVVSGWQADLFDNL
jgi:hypothetical protein